MAVHIELAELAELDEMCEQKTADGGERFTATRITDGLGTRPLPAKVALRSSRWRVQESADRAESPCTISTVEPR